MWFTDEQIRLVDNFEIYIEDNDLAYLDRKMSRLFPDNITGGWREVAERYPIAFASALSAALEYAHLFENN